MEETRDRKKSFYAALGAVIICVLTVAVVYKNVQYNNDVAEQELASLEEKQDTLPDDTAGENLQNSTDAGNGQVESADGQNSQEQLAAVSGKEITTKTGKEKSQKKKATRKSKSEDGQEEASADIETQETLSTSSLSDTVFNEEAGLSWPVDGEILMKYSMDKVVYFKTLAQYKCNPALIIGAATGEQVCAAADCTVTDIATTDETGLTVTTSLDQHYQITYGQLANLKVTVGDKLSAGDPIGEIASPTKYYVTEGSNLYMKVTEDGETVDPLLLLN